MKTLVFLRPTLLALAISAATAVQAAEVIELEKNHVVATSAEELRQALGASVVTAEDLAKSPPTNDISEILRKQPGVNLTGNSGSGARGNNRQIDIRGMGPENTLILVDGKPVSSRNAVRYGWRGDRDTRGDTNWVPASQIERIEVLRGPAASRYGSGAMGGVVNIITKQDAQEHHGNLNLYSNFPEHSEEGATRRMTFGLNGPLTENISYRLYGNVNKTDADKSSINEGRAIGGGDGKEYFTAGREGVRNKDINGQLTWQVDEFNRLKFEAGFGRQGNIYALDSMNNYGTANVQPAAWEGRETNIMYRSNFALTHEGDYDFGSTQSFVQYEKTRNHRLNEGLAGGTEGYIGTGVDFGLIELSNLTAHSEVHIPLSFGFDQMLTVGAEIMHSQLDDSASDLSQRNSGAFTQISTPYDGEMEMKSWAVFVEDNIQLTDSTTLTPALRYDRNDTTGGNWSPSLNIGHALNDYWTLRAGVARAYKAPNLYQLNDAYALYSRGVGCNGGGGACYLLGDSNLKPETSINKEFGVQFSGEVINASLSYFRNDYRNKIEAGREVVGIENGANVFRWSNYDKALVEGIEGNLMWALTERLNWNTNFTWMLESENKETGEPLSIIPQYTINSALDWQVNDPLSLRAEVVWYGKQVPPKLDYHGNLATIAEPNADSEVSPYALFGVSGVYRFSDNLSVGAGVSNLFDKRLYREGNAVIAGANTYNEPGRTFFTSLNLSF